ncbi:hypothetical protein [Tsuneonella dongtanensis]|uniref:hypothetical protein n=1 Tax=Tsuneonella dongtanensis TaxID=692370 RepID=UPI0008376912|nr:hypothetical protein [Tsuneonella dongtanensis]
MARRAILLVPMLSTACAGGAPDYVVRYDLEQVAFETSLRDASPGFSELPRSSPETKAERPSA